MQCSLRKLNFVGPESIDKLFISSDNTLALTDREGGVRLYSVADEASDPTIVASFADHKGPIMDAAFTSISHPFHILTCSYDRSISLRSREGQSFGYKEEDSAIGFFVSCAFIQTESNVFRFLVGSSNGYVLDFDSRNGFEPIKHMLFTESIVSIGAIDDDCVVVCVSSSAPRVYTDRSFQDYLQIQDDTTKNKYKSVSVTGNKNEASVLLVSENGTIDVYRITRADSAIKKEASFEFDQKVLTASWNFSKHSANILVFDSSSDEVQVRIVKENLESAGQWSLSEMKNQQV